MRPNFIDLTGQKFGRLTVLRLASERAPGGKAQWVCLCECGNEKTTPGLFLRKGYARSCGCLQREHQQTRSITHGLSRTSEYRIWGLMIDRCTNPNSPTYQHYGARGIQVCERWRKFENFLADMGNRPSPQHSIERKNNAGNYEPQNCKWATKREQTRNRRTSRMLTFEGQTRTVAEWADITGIQSRTIRARLDEQRWSVERALTVPV
jgi:hypothetical protein